MSEVMNVGVMNVGQSCIVGSTLFEYRPNNIHCVIHSQFVWQEWLPTFEINGKGHENLPNYDYSNFVANPHNFLENKFLDVGTYANAMELYKEDLVELRNQLKIKVSVRNVLIKQKGEGGQSLLWGCQLTYSCSSAAFTIQQQLTNQFHDQTLKS